VAWNEDYGDPNSDVNQFNFHQADPGVDVTASYMRSLPRAALAGEQWLYSTGETNLIGVLVSQATGIPLHQYFSDKIWSRIGSQQDASWLLGPTGHEISGCCVQASTRDFALFGEFIRTDAVIDGESIVPDGWVEQATTNQVTFENGVSGYGYQWWTSNEGRYEARGIFGQGIHIVPALELVIAVNGNWETAGTSEDYATRTALYRDIEKAVQKIR
jgi:CubicO group peptidase (beta-lactamase class C family)